jgi:nucleoid DNA-binding protein
VNRSELISTTASRLDLDPSEVESVMDALFDLCGEVLERGEAVNFRRFGKLEPRRRRAFTKPNPLSGEEMKIPERLSVVFLASDILKERLNGARA